MRKLTCSRREFLRSAGLLAAPILFCLINSAQMTAQPQSAAQSAFEVASVKRVDNSKLGDSISMNIGTVRHEEITFGNATLVDCIRFAYGLSSDTQIAGPDWIKSKEFLYDIVAKGAPGTSREQLGWDDAGHCLRSDSILRSIASPGKCPTMRWCRGDTGRRWTQVKMSSTDDFHGTTWGGRIDSVLTMPTLAHLLSRFDTERPVIDETGLTGMYKVNLLWTPPGRNQGGDNGAEPPLFTAIEDQLGLKLEAKAGPPRDPCCGQRG